ncbi:unnamed protein product [Pleuronectes platessa]|uniref:C-type lectin domain-containing protein n=1 Tax=Pleuronectes platessa TaxID=8262 RepID=A0A9N7W2L7_PLEPL|nr:unnamed protein product [Pleuronectes platessa]
MEGIFIGVLCLSGCLTISTCLRHQYHFVSDAKTWSEAQNYCRARYTDLATIENTEEMKKLNDSVSAAASVKTLVKVRVKLEDSSMDLNNAAVKEQILKKLQERLKENGLSGVALKWKEQADGKVFAKEEKGSDKKKKTEL